MEAETTQSTFEEDRARQTVAYPVRDEADYERLLEQIEDVEGGEVADPAEEISELVL